MTIFSLVETMSGGSRMSCLITMSQKELHRLELIQQIRARRLTVVEAAGLLGLSRSQAHVRFALPTLSKLFAYALGVLPTYSEKA
jgi:hypothetical protein